MTYGEVWTLSEFRQGELREVSLELLAWGRGLADALGTELCAVMLTGQVTDEQLIKVFAYGADKVYLVRDDALSDFLVEPHAKVLQILVETYEPWIFLAAATTTGRTVMPYLSMILHTGLTADCTKLEIEAKTGNLLQIRPAIGGNIMATIKTPESRPQMATVRPKSINLLEPDFSRAGEVVELAAPAELLFSRMTLEELVVEGHSKAALEEAEIVVSGGKGVLESENFKIVLELADALGGVIASARPPVDLGWQPYSGQVGLTGKTISPSLYIACGISGAVQHLAGIQTAKNIIAINIDADAPIFQVADFGIVGDIFEVLPVLIKRIQENDLNKE